MILRFRRYDMSGLVRLLRDLSVALYVVLGSRLDEKE